MTSPCGYNGRILHVDLTHGTFREENLPDEIYRLYVGGGLLGTYLLLRDTKPGLDPLGSDNLLIFVSSVIAGMEGVGLARFSVVTKSPLSGGIGETRCEGPWGRALKASGYDALVVYGQSASPVYLSIDRGRISLQPAEGLWGRDTAFVSDVLEKSHGSRVHVASIGPAGESQVRYASIVADRHYQAMRLGVGAVMGAKRLKAVALVGGSLPPAADPEALAGITTLNAARLQGNDLTRWQKNPPGFAARVDTITDPGYLSVENFRSGTPPDRQAFASQRFLEFYRGEALCPGCPNDCIKQFEVDGEPGSGGMHQEIAGALGPNVGLTDLGTLVRANRYCNLQGLDPSRPDSPSASPWSVSRRGC
jgi:aldehyde:ferredoxin oxidoreductase